jgi:hypothetical protein
VSRRLSCVVRPRGFRRIDDYRRRLVKTKERYPFARWAASGLEQYTAEACRLFTAVFDELIEKLGALGEHAPEGEKIAGFQRAVEALNALNEKDESLIETGEREDLCELCNLIATAAGIDPREYGNGEGPASEWRDW